MAYNETPTDWIAMFLKNREIRVSLEKPSKKETELDEAIAKEIGKSAANVITGVAKELLKPAAFIIVGSIIAVKVVDAACDIAIKKTHAN